MDSKKAVIKTEGQSPFVASVSLSRTPSVAVIDPCATRYHHPQHSSLKIDHLDHGHHMTDTWHAKIQPQKILTLCQPEEVRHLDQVRLCEGSR